MSKTETPVSGGGPDKGKPDGVSRSPGGGDDATVHGRTAGGESGGGAYDNPHTGKTPDAHGFEGGQTENAYHGSGQAGDSYGNAPNGVAGSDSGNGMDAGPAGTAAPTYDPRTIETGTGSFQVVATNGIAEAEATGKVATDAAYESEQNAPGSG